MRSKVLAVGLFVAASACALDEDEADDVGMTEQEVSGWGAAYWGTTTDLDGIDLGWSTTTSSCVLAMVRGDLGEGGYYQIKDVRSAAGVSGNYDTNRWFLYAHGGAYTDQTNSRVWANNKVNAGAVCVPYPAVDIAQFLWNSGDVPLRLAGVGTAANRRCFLQAIYGGGQIFTHANDYVRVRKYTTTDASHPSTGWYLEGNLKRNQYTGQPATVAATCIDFPSIDAEWYGGFGDATYTLTEGPRAKMCGLTTVSGAFNVNSWDDGVKITSPSTFGGNWKMTVSPGKYADFNCIE
jgi:hypothetical protein